MTLGLLTSAAIVGVFLGWGTFTNIAGAIVTSGQIEVEQNRQVVQHADGGTVEAILVTEGRTVEAGETLLRLDGSLLKSELAIVEGQFFEILARRGRLEAERDDLPAPVFPPALIEAAATRGDIASLMVGQVRLFEARADTVARQAEQLAKRSSQTRLLIDGIDAQIAAIGQQLDFIRQELASQQELLAKGLAQASRVLALQREEARLAGTLGELRANRAQSEERIIETEVEVLRLSAARREEANTQLRDIGFRELELAERRRALIERIDRLDVRAPVSGIVLGLRVTTPRAVIRPADPIMFLIPQDRPLVIATRVPTVHIDQVHVGQEAKLLFSALSTRTTPEIEGRVTVVSADVFVDEASQMPYYRAEIELMPGEREKLGNVVLLPGMPVEAFIKTDDRSPLSYLVKPFTDYFNRAFRET
ncbi:MAG: HlyD family type I secretion periplasmic adaptor subunit [Gemmobacter sp.]